MGELRQQIDMVLAPPTARERVRARLAFKETNVRIRGGLTNNRRSLEFFWRYVGFHYRL